MVLRSASARRTDALGRRVKKHLNADADDDFDTFEHLYYNAGWQILETRETASENGAPRRTHVVEATPRARFPRRLTAVPPGLRKPKAESVYETRSERGANLQEAACGRPFLCASAPGPNSRSQPTLWQGLTPSGLALGLPAS